MCPFVKFCVGMSGTSESLALPWETWPTLCLWLWTAHPFSRRIHGYCFCLIFLLSLPFSFCPTSLCLFVWQFLCLFSKVFHEGMEGEILEAVGVGVSSGAHSLVVQRVLDSSGVGSSPRSATLWLCRIGLWLISSHFLINQKGITTLTL